MLNIMIRNHPYGQISKTFYQCLSNRFRRNLKYIFYRNIIYIYHLVSYDWLPSVLLFLKLKKLIMKTRIVDKRVYICFLLYSLYTNVLECTQMYSNVLKHMFFKKKKCLVVAFVEVSNSFCSHPSSCFFDAFLCHFLVLLHFVFFSFTFVLFLYFSISFYSCLLVTLLKTSLISPYSKVFSTKNTLDTLHCFPCNFFYHNNLIVDYTNINEDKSNHKTLKNSTYNTISKFIKWSFGVKLTLNSLKSLS